MEPVLSVGIFILFAPTFTIRLQFFTVRVCPAQDFFFNSSKIYNFVDSSIISLKFKFSFYLVSPS